MISHDLAAFVEQQALRGALGWQPGAGTGGEQANPLHTAAREHGPARDRRHYVWRKAHGHSLLHRVGAAVDGERDADTTDCTVKPNGEWCGLIWLWDKLRRTSLWPTEMRGQDDSDHRNDHDDDTVGHGHIALGTRKQPMAATEVAAGEERTEAEDEEEGQVDPFLSRLERVSRIASPPTRFYVVMGAILSCPVSVYFLGVWAGIWALVVFLSVGAAVAKLGTTHRRAVDMQYQGVAFNALLQLKTDAAPALYMRRVPNYILFGMLLLTTGLVVLAGSLSAGATPFSCSADGGCAQTLTSQLALSIILYSVFLVATSTYCMYFTLVPPAQTAVLDAVLQLSKNPTCNEILSVAEKRVSTSEASVYTAFPCFSIFLQVLPLVMAIDTLLRTLSWQEEYGHATWSSFFGSILMLMNSFFMFQTTAVVAFAIWATLRGAYLRLEAVTDFAVFRGITSLQTLFSWFRVRDMYVTVLLPCLYLAASPLLLCPLVLALVSSFMVIGNIVTLLQFNDTTTSDLISSSWVFMVLFLVNVGTLLLGLNAVVRSAFEMEEHRRLLGSAKIHSGIRKATGGSCTATSDQAEVLVETMEGLGAHMENEDEDPQIWGVTISPTVVRSVIGYTASLTGTLLVVIYQSL